MSGPRRVAFHVTSASDWEATYLGMALIRSMYGLPLMADQFARNRSYVTRPMTKASESSNSSIASCVASSSKAAQRSGDSITPSSETRVDSISLRTNGAHGSRWGRTQPTRRRIASSAARSGIVCPIVLQTAPTLTPRAGLRYP
jgi:hypothetical protein